jgi:hypothetical protein
MDNTTPQPNAPVNPSPTVNGVVYAKDKNNSAKKLLIIEIIVVLGLLLGTGTLNYFNVLPLSQNYPDQLGFLPHVTPQATITEIAEDKISNIRPIDPKFEAAKPVQVVYSFEGVLLGSIRQEDGIYKFSINAPDASFIINNVTVSPNVRILIASQSASLEEVAALPVNVRAQYDLNTSTWTAVHINTVLQQR